MNDEPQLIDQPGVDEAPSRASAPDEVDVLARLPLQAAMSSSPRTKDVLGQRADVRVLDST